MSIAIDPDKVTEVLLADGWHKVLKKSFGLDSFEFVGEDEFIYHSGGTGFYFYGTKDGDKESVCGNINSIIAVRRK